jgi:hypothetical protein
MKNIEKSRPRHTVNRFTAKRGESGVVRKRNTAENVPKPMGTADAAPACASNRAAATAHTTIMGADRHVEAAQSSLSTTTPPPRDEAEEILRIVAYLAGILKVDPKHQRAVQPAVGLIKRQVMEIGRLREALLQVCAELRGIVGELKGEELKVIVSLQGMIFDLLDIGT